MVRGWLLCFAQLLRTLYHVVIVNPKLSLSLSPQPCHPNLVVTRRCYILAQAFPNALLNPTHDLLLDAMAMRVLAKERQLLEVCWRAAVARADMRETSVTGRGARMRGEV